MIAKEITKKIQDAMKAKDELRLSTLRMLSSALNYEKIAKQHDLSEKEELVVVQKEAKKRKDAIEAFRQAQGKNSTSTEDEVKTKIEKEENELKILQKYLPDEISDEELNQLVEESIKKLGIKDIKDMGKAIGMVKGKVGMRADGAKIAQFVRKSIAG